MHRAARRPLVAAAATGRPSFGHVPALDGLRGIALLGVLFFHAGQLRGGYLGVDLFFVLSGFLITSLLLAEAADSGRIDLRQFWTRRLRRLLPAALVLLLVVLAVAAVTMASADLHRLRGDAIAGLFDVFNWRAIGAGHDYWAGAAAPSPLEHLWSLSLEEQVYLIWPVVVVGALAIGRRRGSGRRPLVLTAVGLLVASVAAMVHFGLSGQELRAYYGTDARASSVLLGGLLALLVDSRRGRRSQQLRRGVSRLAPVAGAGLVAAWVLVDGQSDWLYRGGLPLLSLAATVVVGAVVLTEARWVRALEVSPLQWLGRVSYGAYLWHWPIYLALDEDVVADHGVRTLVQISASLGAAALSAVLIERPVRSGRVTTIAWPRLAFGGAGAALAATILVTSGAAGPPRSGELLEAAADLDAPSLLLVGDSESYLLGEEHEAAAEAFAVTTLSFFGCGIGPGSPTVDSMTFHEDPKGMRCTEAVDRFDEVIDERDPDLVLVGVGALEILDREIDAQRVRFGTPEWDALTRERLRSTMASFRAGGRRVVAMAASCFDPREAEHEVSVSDEQLAELDALRADDARVQRWNELLREVAAETGVEVLPYDDVYCDVPVSEQPERYDGVHLSPEGAHDVWQWLVPQLQGGTEQDGLG